VHAAVTVGDELAGALATRCTSDFAAVGWIFRISEQVHWPCGRPVLCQRLWVDNDNLRDICFHHHESYDGGAGILASNRRVGRFYCAPKTTGSRKEIYTYGKQLPVMGYKTGIVGGSRPTMPTRPVPQLPAFSKSVMGDVGWGPGLPETFNSAFPFVLSPHCMPLCITWSVAIGDLMGDFLPVSNHLTYETSPYLKQHADNPVDWYPWKPETLRVAQAQDKPILLSIGYSACHWCHVMARESFEDADVADLMNRLFINIKVDREERPDLDQIYQAAHAVLTQRHGGWPLTMFLSPDGTPFFGGTYFPKQGRYNLPSFPDVLKRVAAVYAEDRAHIEAHGKQLRGALAEGLLAHGKSAPLLHDAPLTLAVEQLTATCDPVHGGFGSAPKFPHAVELDFLLRYSRATASMQTQTIVLHSLQQMARGGIYDQLGGGFCRYSVDEHWGIPHFEKMLYDNGLLLALYSDAWQTSGSQLFAQVVQQTADWVIREMQAPQGGYFSSLDADSEHEEGKFYVWQRDEVRSLLSDAEFSVAALHYGFDGAPNFEQHAWHMCDSMSLSEAAARLDLSLSQATERLASANRKLLAAREQRIRPGRDEKVMERVDDYRHGSRCSDIRAQRLAILRSACDGFCTSHLMAR
jgi:hypothetical protein